MLPQENFGVLDLLRIVHFRGHSGLLACHMWTQISSDYWSVFTCDNYYWYLHTVGLRYTTIMNNSTLIVATDEKEKCKPQRVSPTPWFVQQSKNQRGSAPPNLMTGGAIAPPAPLVLTPVLKMIAVTWTRFVLLLIPRLGNWKIRSANSIWESSTRA